MSNQITESNDIDFKSTNFLAGFALAMAEMLRNGAHPESAEATAGSAGVSLQEFEDAGIAQFDYDTLDEHKHRIWPDEFEAPENERPSYRMSLSIGPIATSSNNKSFMTGMVKKKLPPMQKWKMDFGFFSYEIKVSARSKTEARKKAVEKLQKVPVSRYINKKITFLSKQ